MLNIFKSQLAMAYFPDARFLSKQITCNAPLLATLQATGYDHHTIHRFSPEQQQLLFLFLGEHLCQSPAAARQFRLTAACFST